MAVMRVSSSEFRVKMKDLGNAIGEEQHRVIVTRHGGRVFVAVSWEDYEFLEKHKRGPTLRPVPDPEPVDPVVERMDHPDRMETADIEHIYELTNGSKDDEIKSWRFKAWVVLRARGREPKEKWYVSSPEPKSSVPPGGSERGGPSGRSSA